VKTALKPSHDLSSDVAGIIYLKACVLAVRSRVTFMTELFCL